MLNYYFHMLDRAGKILVTEEMTHEEVSNPFITFDAWVRTEKWNHKTAFKANLVADADGIHGIVLKEVPVRKKALKDYEHIEVVSMLEMLEMGSNPITGLDFTELLSDKFTVHVVDDADDNELVDIVLNSESFGMMYIIHEATAKQLNFFLGYGERVIVEFYPNFGDYVNEVLLKCECLTELEQKVWAEYFYL